jgi:hypothetical protein
MVIQTIFPWWPFVEYVDCARCGLPVETRTAVAVVNGGNLAGMAHESCPEDVVADVPVKGGLL